MDDFYLEMKDFLESEDKTSNIENQFVYRSQSSDLNFLTSMFPNMFAEALVPINPARWPAFGAGSVMGIETEETFPETFSNRLIAPIDNLVVAKEYLESSQSDIQWRARWWQVCEDTATINLASELGGDVGSFVAGATSNKMTHKYMQEMYETEWAPNPMEKLNAEIFKLEAKELNIDPATVRGTGTARELVPISMQGSIWDRPPRNARPSFSFGDDNNGLSDNGIIIDPNPKNPFSGPSDSSGSSSNSDLSTNSNFESSNYSSGNDCQANSDDSSIFGRVRGFFGIGSSETEICPAIDNPNLSEICSADNSSSPCVSGPDDYYSSSSADECQRTFFEMLFGFFVPTDGGGGMCPDPTSASAMMPMYIDMGCDPSEVKNL